MTDGAGVTAAKSTTAALLESMQAVEQALTQPAGVSPAQLRRQIQEWQQLVTELAGEPAYGTGLAALYEEIIGVLNSSLDLTETLGLVMDSLIHLTGAKRGCLMLLDGEGNLETRAMQHFDQDSINAADLELSHTVVREAMEKGAPVLTTNAQLDSRFADYESVVGYQLRSIVCVPLHVRERVIGALYLDNRMRDGVFSQADLPMLTAFANQSAIAIENARLYTMTDQARAAQEEELQQARRAQSEFVSLVVHKLSTPMTSIRGYAEMLEKGTVGPLTPDQAGFMHAITRNAERMQSLVSNLLDISRIESNRLRLEMKPTALSDALERALQSTQVQIEERSQQLTVEMPEDLPPVHADPARLEQIMTNLLNNACKYTPKGGHIGVRMWQQDEYLHCAVSDTGIGISPGDQARLFTKFFRSEDPIVREKFGAGLGLCIAKSLVELQGGEIKVESQFGKGTTCTFTTPVVKE